MKRILSLALSVVIPLLLWGCKSSGIHTAGTTETTAALPTREPTTQLEFFLEGMAEYQNAALYTGDGYSLYITDDGWLEKPGENGQMTWQSSYNPDISLTVIPNAGATPRQATDAIFQGYTLSAQEGEYCYGHSADELFYRAARLMETPNGILAVTWDYSLEAAEGFGVRLRVIAGTLETAN